MTRTTAPAAIILHGLAVDLSDAILNATKAAVAAGLTVEEVRAHALELAEEAATAPEDSDLFFAGNAFAVMARA